jgi:hypothetical protein
MGLLRDLHDELKLRSEKGTDETMISVDAVIPMWFCSPENCTESTDGAFFNIWRVDSRAVAGSADTCGIRSRGSTEA